MLSFGPDIKTLLLSSCLLVSTDDKPVILVLMHHDFEPCYVSPLRTWKKYPNVVLSVHVFYHETKGGLLKCNTNDDTISYIGNKLLEYSTQMHPGENLQCRSFGKEQDFYGDEESGKRGFGNILSYFSKRI